jgi:hypothetical protein
LTNWSSIDTNGSIFWVLAMPAGKGNEVSPTAI